MLLLLFLSLHLALALLQGLYYYKRDIMITCV